VALGYLGSKPAEQPYVAFAQIATAYYFFHFLILLPLLGKLERPKPLPTSISEPVLKGGGMMAGAAAKPMEKP
jgi:ubiquinol-cytochrome c reductase cytochrome b subunit